MNACYGLALIMCLAVCSGLAAGERVREPVVAGRFYPGGKEELARSVDDFLAKGAKRSAVEGKPIAVVAPHAGYTYSGRCAGAAFAPVKGKTYKRVVVLAVNHRGMPFRGGSILDVDAYRTPLGTVPLDREACEALRKTRYIGTHPSAHRAEHSLEVELPFLQRALGSFQLVPIVVGHVVEDEFAAMAAEVRSVVDDDTLVVASCDFTHYGANFRFAPFREKVRENIEKLDKGAVAEALKLDGPAFTKYITRTGATICGRYTVRVLLEMLPEKAKGTLVDYYTSGDANGDYRQSVSYAGIVFTAEGQWGPPPKRDADAEGAAKPAADVDITAAGQRRLLDIARKTLEAVTAGKPIPELDEAAEELQGRYGVFVTLNKEGKLRGCIGNFRPDTPLYKTVAAQARMSALRDRRFQSVRAEEVKAIDIEISVLLPAKPIKDPLGWELGKHGIIVRRGLQQATFLPQVAEHFKTKQEMLAACCRKAGMLSYVWREPETQVFIYRAQVFGEKSLGGKP